MYMAPIDKATAVPLLVATGERRAVRGPAPPNEDFPRLVRFTGAAVGVTLLAAALYLIGAVTLGLAPQIANIGAATAATVVALLVHRRHATDETGMSGVVAVAAIGLALNLFWVWLAVTACDEAAWTPVPPMLLGTPLATFAAGRLWVFR